MSSPSKETLNYRDYSKDPISRKCGVVAYNASSVHFPTLLHILLLQAEKLGYSHICSWQPHGRAFKIYNREKFVEKMAPLFSKQTRFGSFQRQLNFYGFARISRRGNDHGAYYHELFLRGRPDLCLRLARCKPLDERDRMKRFPPDFYAMEPVVSNKSLQASALENEEELFSPSGIPCRVAPCVGNNVELSGMLGSTQVENVSSTPHVCGHTGYMSDASQHQHVQSTTEHFLSDSSSLDLLQQQSMPVVQCCGYHPRLDDFGAERAAVFLMPPTLYPHVSAGLNVVSELSDKSSSMNFAGAAVEAALSVPLADFTTGSIAPKHSIGRTIELAGVRSDQQASDWKTDWSSVNDIEALGVVNDDDVVVEDVFKISSHKSSPMHASPGSEQKWKEFASEMEKSLRILGSDIEGMESPTQMDDMTMSNVEEMVFFLQDVDLEFEDSDQQNEDPLSL